MLISMYTVLKNSIVASSLSRPGLASPDPLSLWVALCCWRFIRELTSKRKLRCNVTPFFLPHVPALNTAAIF